MLVLPVKDNKLREVEFNISLIPCGIPRVIFISDDFQPLFSMYCL